MSNGTDGPSRRYTDRQVLVNGERRTTHDDDDDDWRSSFDVNLLLEDAPVYSIRQRANTSREESIINANESSVNENDDKKETLELDLIDGQVSAELD